MPLEKTAPVLVKVYDSGEAELAKVWLGVHRRGNKDLLLRIPGSVSGLDAGDYFSLFEVGKDRYRACKVHTEGLPCAEFLKLHHVFGFQDGSYMNIDQEAKRIGIEPLTQIILVQTPEHAYRVETQKDESDQNIHAGFLSRIEVHGRKRGMKVPFSAPCFVATYITVEGKLLMKPIEQPACSGKWLSTTKIILNSEEGKKEGRLMTLPQSLAYLRGRCVAIKGEKGLLQIDAVPNSMICEPGYDFKSASRIFDSWTDNGIMMFIPKDTAEKALGKGSWVKQHANGEGQFELEKLQIKTMPGMGLVRVSKLFRHFNDVAFLVPARAARALGLKREDILSIYNNNGMLELVKGREENANFLGESEIGFSKSSTRIYLPKEAGEIGFDETTFVIVRLSGNKVFLENANVGRNSSVSKLAVVRETSKPDKYRLVLANRLREKVHEGNYALVFEKRQ